MTGWDVEEEERQCGQYVFFPLYTLQKCQVKVNVLRVLLMLLVVVDPTRDKNGSRCAHIKSCRLALIGTDI